MNTLQMLVKDTVRIYNTQCPHSSCQMLTPDFMRKQREIVTKTYKNPTVSSVRLKQSDKITNFV
jgi:nitrite reductase/ring-hydroxylating ferredoxin subunit